MEVFEVARAPELRQSFWLRQAIEIHEVDGARFSQSTRRAGTVQSLAGFFAK
ncbi:hypothetical protein [Streptomyces luteireticuli]|uniref:hypothetical protein n=1 Tax=Streptomyces luteireticuli TaxID=173858 RepID=UPI003557A53D